MTGPDQQCAGTIGDKTFTAACDLTTYQGGFSSNDCQKRYCTGPSDKCLAYTYSLEITGGDDFLEPRRRSRLGRRQLRLVRRGHQRWDGGLRHGWCVTGDDGRRRRRQRAYGR